MRTEADATDFMVHATDDRLYTLTQAGTRIVSVQRQQPRQSITSWTLPSKTVAIHPAPVGRLVVVQETNTIQMHNSITGALIGSSVSLSPCITRTPAAGNFLYAAVNQSSTVTGLANTAWAAAAYSTMPRSIGRAPLRTVLSSQEMASGFFTKARRITTCSAKSPPSE